MTFRSVKRLYPYLEIAAVMFAFVWGIVYPIVTPFLAVDLDILMKAGKGETLSGFYYAPWSLPFFWLLSQMPYIMARIIVNLLSLTGFLYAIQVFKGNKVLFFTSYALLFVMFYGQTDGIIVAALAFMLVALKNDRGYLGGAAWLLALTKLHVGVPLGFGVFWIHASNNRVRAQVIGVITVVLLLSCVIWPNWIPGTAERLIAERPLAIHGFDMWDVLGPAALLFLVPLLLSPKPTYRWWVATYMLSAPYFNIYYLTNLLVMPTSGVGWLIDLAYIFGYQQFTYLMLIPLTIYLIEWRHQSNNRSNIGSART